jgi:hypothetical protein
VGVKEKWISRHKPNLAPPPPPTPPPPPLKWESKKKGNLDTAKPGKYEHTDRKREREREREDPKHNMDISRVKKKTSFCSTSLRRERDLL